MATEKEKSKPDFDTDLLARTLRLKPNSQKNKRITKRTATPVNPAVAVLLGEGAGGLRNSPHEKLQSTRGGEAHYNGSILNLSSVIGRHAALNALTWFVCLIASYEGGREEPSRSGDILPPLLRGSARLNGENLHL